MMPCSTQSSSRFSAHQNEVYNQHWKFWRGEVSLRPGTAIHLYTLNVFVSNHIYRATVADAFLEMMLLGISAGYFSTGNFYARTTVLIRACEGIVTHCKLHYSDRS